jgi:RNA polymerase sigma-70 factor (ECF subfamily)
VYLTWNELGREKLVSEASLILQARQGDGTVWEKLIAQHQDAVFRLAYLLLGDADEADDVAQETFIRAYRALDRFDVNRPLRPWLMQIAANLARNQRRSVGRYFAAVQRLIRAEPGAAFAPSGHEHLVERERAHTLWQAVRRLGQADQQIIYLRYFLEMSEAETAAALEIPPGTVKSRTHRALARLRDVVKREYPTLRENLEP